MAAPMAAVGIGATLAGAFVSAAGDIFAGKANSALYNYQSGLAMSRAQIARQNAAYDIAAGETNALETGLHGQQVSGAIRAGQGAGNINVAGGSAADVSRSQTYGNQLGQNIQRTNAARRAYNQEVQAATDVSQASAYSAAASTSKTASYIGAASDILSGFGSVASKWSQASLALPPSQTTNQDESVLVGGA